MRPLSSNLSSGSLNSEINVNLQLQENKMATPFVLLSALARWKLGNLGWRKVGV